MILFYSMAGGMQKCGSANFLQIFAQMCVGIQKIIFSETNNWMVMIYV